MKLKTPPELATVLVSAGIATNETLVGLTTSEVLNIEQQFQVVLPESYKSFLLTMGREAGAFNGELLLTTLLCHLPLV
ncbi:MAG: SMI1/KNR4 family protein [Cyanobacteria bacterium SZAS-4]|nr:SMI1/KNR4 family protein [Cyanobacteria bacterium SZAS-4]